MLGLTPAAVTLPLFLPQAPPDKVSGLIHAATLLGQLLGQGRALDSRALRSAMEVAFGGSDADGAWVWKDAYEALEAAQVLFLRKFGAAMRARAGSAAAMLEMLTRLAGRLASQTRRSEESEHFQQFSTPLALGFVAAETAALTPGDVVLEPSAGTELLAIFAELATLRTQARSGKVGRVQQIIDWLGREFDGVIVFDEAHAMANAAGEKSDRGEKKPSQQGQAGLRLQHALADARVLYVSATGATTVQNLAYAARLGLWGTGDFPFATRADFVAAMEQGGVAAMEVLARDLKALGLYAARSLSFEESNTRSSSTS